VEQLRLDLETLQVESLDVAVTGLNGGLEAFGMGHASTELGQSCAGEVTCEEEGAGTSCNDTDCDCDDCEG